MSWSLHTLVHVHTRSDTHTSKKIIIIIIHHEINEKSLKHSRPQMIATGVRGWITTTDREASLKKTKPSDPKKGGNTSVGEKRP